jgi:hypothetical protein
MTFRKMQHVFKTVPMDVCDETALKTLNKAVPSLRHLARSSCAKYLNADPEKLLKRTIEHHILEDYEFDSIDIAKIVGEFGSNTAHQIAVGNAETVP